LPLLTIFCVLAASLSLPPARATLARFSETFRERKTFLSGGQFRNILHSIAWKMTLDKPWFGHGAGCYILLFTEYHPKVPEYMDSIKRDHPTTHRILHSHADGDWIEFTAEYGLIGTALLAIPWVAWLLRLFQFRPLHPAVIILSLGVGFVLIHGWFDFVLRNPAILGLTGVLAVVAISTARINTLNPSEKLTPTAPITAASA
jgi:O-antigen ligase